MSGTDALTSSTGTQPVPGPLWRTSEQPAPDLHSADLHTADLHTAEPLDRSEVASVRAPAGTPLVLAILWLGLALTALVVASDPYFGVLQPWVLGRSGHGFLSPALHATIRVAGAGLLVAPLLLAVLLGARGNRGRMFGVLATLLAAASLYAEPSPGVASTWWVPATGSVVAYTGWLVARRRRAWTFITVVPAAAAAVAWYDATGWARQLRHLIDSVPWNVYTLSVGWSRLALPVALGLLGLLAAAGGQRTATRRSTALSDYDDGDAGLFR